MVNKKLMRFAALFACFVLLFATACGGGNEGENDSGKTDSSVCKHEYEVTEHGDPTCLKSGYDIFTCKHCGLSYAKTGAAALGHSWGEWSEKTAASCKVNGSEERECSRCKEKELNDVFVEHTYTLTERVAPTCTAGGHDKYTCSVCNNVKIVTFDKKGHTPKAAGTVTKPTCTEEGYTAYICKDCNESYVDRYVKANGHTYPATGTTVASTCGSYGHTAKSCTACGHEAYFDINVDRPSHTFNASGVCTGCNKTAEQCFALKFSDSKNSVFAEIYKENLTPTVPTAIWYRIFADNAGSYNHKIIIEKNVLEQFAAKGYRFIRLQAGRLGETQTAHGFRFPGNIVRGSNVFNKTGGESGQFRFANDDGTLINSVAEGLSIDTHYRTMTGANTPGLLTEYMLRLILDKTEI